MVIGLIQQFAVFSTYGNGQYLLAYKSNNPLKHQYLYANQSRGIFMAGVMAAPNSTRVQAVIEIMNSSTDQDGKVELSLIIGKVEALYGPCFIHVGEQINVFTYESVNDLEPGQGIIAEIEYIGGATRGVYQITKIIEDR